MTKEIDDLLIERFTVGFSSDEADVLRALARWASAARRNRVSISDLIRAATRRYMDEILPCPDIVLRVPPKDRST